MKRYIQNRTVILLIISLAAWAFESCSPSSSASGPEPAVKVEPAPDASSFAVDRPEQFPLVTVEQRKWSDELRVNGVVAPDVNRAVPVLSLAGGRAVDVRARLGDDVSKGQVLLLINSPDVAMAFSDYQKAQADELLARRQLARAQLLFAKGAIAQKDLEVAEDAEEKAKVDVRTAAERIRVLGADIDHPSPIVEVRAPISGTIVEQNVTSGAGVRSLDNSPNLFTIADLSRVWVLCDVYENNLPQVRLGDFADARLNAYPDRLRRARVSNISRVLDPVTRTAKVRLELDNPGRLIRAGMFVTAVFHSPTRPMRPVVPATAVLRMHDKDWVFIPKEERRFRRIEIQAGPVSSDGFQEVLGGLASGDKIVADALQFSSVSGAE